MLVEIPCQRFWSAPRQYRFAWPQPVLRGKGLRSEKTGRAVPDVTEREMIGPYELIQTDLLILNDDDAGLLTAIHTHDTDPLLDITVMVKALFRKDDYTRLV